MEKQSWSTAEGALGQTALKRGVGGVGEISWVLLSLQESSVQGQLHNFCQRSKLQERCPDQRQNPAQNEEKGKVEKVLSPPLALPSCLGNGEGNSVWEWAGTPGAVGAPMGQPWIKAQVLG